MIGEPQFTAPICKKCNFVGNWLGYDAYICEGRIVLINSSEPHDERSYRIQVLREVFAQFIPNEISQVTMTKEVLIAFLAANIASLKGINANV